MSRIIKRFLLVLAAPVLVLAVAEGVLRVLDCGHPTSFLVADTIGGRPVWRDNPFFGYRFFPERMTRTSQPIVLDRKKPKNVIRVFVLGESAAMGEPQANFGLSRFLECLLAGRLPGKKVEVINAAMTAVNSHVIVEIAHGCAAVAPDYLVVYMGNNEVVGPYGPGTVFGHSTRITPWRVLATRLRLTQWLRWDYRGSRWAGMEMFRDKQVAVDDDRLDTAYDNFLANLNRIIAIGRRAGADVVLSTVAVNLRDCAPFAGDRARRLFEQGEFSKARDQDTLRFRADSIMNGNIRNVGNWSPIPVHLVDAEALFGVAGKEYFVDHVHFNTAGNYKLACAVADQIAPPPQQVPTLSDCLARMLYTPWNELDVVDAMLVRRSRAPFLGQPGNEEQRNELAARKAELWPSLQREGLARWRESFAKALASDPDDWRLRAAWAELLMNAGAFDEAEQQLRAELQLLPYRYDVAGGLALVLAYEGRVDEGVKMLEDLPASAGHYPSEHMLETARTLARDKLNAAALAFAEAGARRAPADPDICIELAERYAAVGRTGDAERALRAVLAKDATNEPARNELAALLALHERWDEAESVLKESGDTAAMQLKLEQLRQAKKRRDAVTAAPAPNPQGSR